MRQQVPSRISESCEESGQERLIVGGSVCASPLLNDLCLLITAYLRVDAAQPLGSVFESFNVGSPANHNLLRHG